MSSTPIITASNLTIGWGSTILMHEIAFNVKRGEVFIILGGSGCGKSTLLRHLIGLQRPLDGRIHIDGVGDPAEHTGAPAFGVMFQSGALLGSLDLMANCELPLKAWTDARDRERKALIQAKLDLVGLGPFAHHLPEEISGGMKKRAAIARALMLEPELLFLDEPSAGLDPISAVELDDLITTLARELGITIVIVTHELPSIFRIADRCIMLDKISKGIIADGDPRLLRDSSQHPFVHQFFNRLSSNSPNTEKGASHG